MKAFQRILAAEALLASIIFMATSCTDQFYDYMGDTEEDSASLPYTKNSEIASGVSGQTAVIPAKDETQASYGQDVSSGNLSPVSDNSGYNSNTESSGNSSSAGGAPTPAPSDSGSGSSAGGNSSSAGGAPAPTPSGNGGSGTKMPGSGNNTSGGSSGSGNSGTPSRGSSSGTPTPAPSGSGSSAGGNSSSAGGAPAPTPSGNGSSAGGNSSSASGAPAPKVSRDDLSALLGTYTNLSIETLSTMKVGLDITVEKDFESGSGELFINERTNQWEKGNNVTAWVCRVYKNTGYCIIPFEQYYNYQLKRKDGSAFTITKATLLEDDAAEEAFKAARTSTGL